MNTTKIILDTIDSISPITYDEFVSIIWSNENDDDFATMMSSLMKHFDENERIYNNNI